MKDEIRATVHRTAAVTAAIAAVLSPIPLADEIVLFPIYASLAKKIGRAHGLSPNRVPWRPILATATTGLAARAALNLAVSFVPGVAAVANAASAAALTEVFGRYADEACQSPSEAEAWSFRDMMSALRRSVATPAA